MKKIIAIILTLSMLLALLASCQNEEASSSSESSQEQSQSESSQKESQSESSSSDEQSSTEPLESSSEQSKEQSSSETEPPKADSMDTYLIPTLATTAEQTPTLYYPTIDYDYLDLKIEVPEWICASYSYRIIETYGELCEVIEKTAQKPDERLFDDNFIFALFCNPENGDDLLEPFYHSLEISENEIKLKSDYINDKTRSDRLIGDIEMHFLVVPKSELTAEPSLDAKITVEEGKRPFPHEEIKQELDLELEEDTIFILDSQSAFDKFEADYNVPKSSLEKNFNRYFFVAYYKHRENRGSVGISFEGLTALENGKYVIQEKQYLNSEDSAEDAGPVLYYIMINRGRLSNENVSEITQITLNKASYTVEKQYPQNTAYENYYHVLKTVYGDECSDALPKEYGDYFWLIDSSEDYEKYINTLSGLTKEPDFDKYFVIAIYRYYESYDYKITGFRDLETEGSALSVVVDDYAVAPTETEYKSLSFIIFSRDMLKGLSENTDFTLISNKINYYNQLLMDNVNYSDEKKNTALIFDDYEKFNIWKNSLNDKSVGVLDAIGEQDFNSCFILAVYDMDGYGYGVNIGYRDFYCDEEGMHITLDYSVSYFGDDEINTRYCVLLIPKELCPQDAAQTEIDVNTNLIHQEAEFMYAY